MKSRLDYAVRNKAITEAYLSGEKSVKGICEKYSISATRLRDILRQNGVETLRSGKAIKQPSEHYKPSRPWQVGLRLLGFDNMSQWHLAQKWPSIRELETPEDVIDAVRKKTAKWTYDDLLLVPNVGSVRAKEIAPNLGVTPKPSNQVMINTLYDRLEKAEKRLEKSKQDVDELRKKINAAKRC